MRCADGLARNPSWTAQKARDLGLTILDEAGFVQLLATGTVEAADDADDANDLDAAEATEVADAADE